MFILGFFIGGFFGIMVMAVVQIGKDDNNE